MPCELGVPSGVLLLHATPMINLRRELADPMRPVAAFSVSRKSRVFERRCRSAVRALAA